MIDLAKTSTKELEDLIQLCAQEIENRNIDNIELIEKAKEKIRSAVAEYMASPPIDETINIQIRVTHTPKDPQWIMNGDIRQDLQTEIKADPEWQEWAEETLRYMLFDYYIALAYEARHNEYLQHFPVWKQTHIIDEVRKEYVTNSPSQ